jgi:hypothetical protein
MFSVFQFNSSCLKKLVCLGLDSIGDDGFHRLNPLKGSLSLPYLLLRFVIQDFQDHAPFNQR